MKITHKKRVLYVDGNPEAYRLASFLTQYEVVMENSKASAFLLAKTEFFDCYLMEVGLTYGNGIELCKALRAFDSNTPIVFCTTDGQDASRLAALSAGAQAYFVQPIDYFFVSDVIDKLILQAEVRSYEARVLELNAIRDEINERLSRISFSLRNAELKSIRAQNRAVKILAEQAFSKAGGSRAHFERLWPDTSDKVLRDFESERMIVNPVAD